MKYLDKELLLKHIVRSRDRADGLGKEYKSEPRAAEASVLNVLAQMIADGVFDAEPKSQASSS